jgi:hypothetical protein
MKKAALLIILIAAFVLIKPAAKAQVASPQFLITWSASNSYAPSFYQGKVLPGSQSQITAALEIVSGGKIANVTSQPIYWYLDGTLIGGGTGVQQITFSPFGTAPEIETLEADLPNYSGGMLIHQISIPVMNPDVVIDAPYPGGQFSNTIATVTALPYFFNTTASNLVFAWSVNGVTGSNVENPDVAQITLPTDAPSGSTVAVSLQAQNPSGSQTANASANLTYQKQL